MGMKPFDAAMKGSREIGFTVLSMSTSLIAVFIPILLMGGIVGKLFREFAVTLSVAIAVSLLVSLTTTPMLCAHFLKSRDESRHGKIYRASERTFQWMHNEYANGLRWVLRHQALMLCVVVGTIALNVYLFMIVPKGFFPQQDTGRIGGQTMAAQDISFPAMRDKQRELAQMVLDDPAARAAAASILDACLSHSSRSTSAPAGFRPIRWSPGCAASSPAFRVPFSICRSSRIFRLVDAARPRSTSTRSPTKT
jgi:multidrug efflux pump